MDNPSWLDAIRASCQCLPCLSNASASDDEDSRPSRSLAPLLADSTSSSEEAETVSLHSNIGSRQNRKRRRRRKKDANITLFGYNLFGAPRGAIHLPDDGEDNINTIRQPRRSTSGSSSSPSRLTFDSDATQLDPATIDELTPEELRQRAREAAEKEDRRKKRKERKQMKRLAEALAAGGGSGEEFEGFQGSGDLPVTSPRGSEYRAIPSPLLHPPQEDDGTADLDGGSYARNGSGAGSNSGRSGSRSGSDYSNPLPRPSKSKKSKSSSSRSDSPSLASPLSTGGLLNLPSPNPFSKDSTGFPSPGLGGGRGIGRGGAFLATRGDNDDI